MSMKDAAVHGEASGLAAQSEGQTVEQDAKDISAKKKQKKKNTCKREPRSVLKNSVQPRAFSRPPPSSPPPPYSLLFWMKMLSVSWSPSLRIFSLYILAMAEMKHWRISRTWPTPRDRSRPSSRSLHSCPGRDDVHDSLLLRGFLKRAETRT